MAESATLNVRMDVETKSSFIAFCDEIGMSASSLMNVFAKTVVRNQAIPFPITSRATAPAAQRYASIFPQDEEELEEMLSRSEQTSLADCSDAARGAASIREQMGW